MIDYNTARRLKDAGFSQEKRGGLYFEPTHFGASGHIVKKPITNHCVYIPTLSELIEACGDKFKKLQKNGKLWSAHSTKWKEHAIDNYVGDYEKVTGPSPEEAVANLWLKLVAPKFTREDLQNVVRSLKKAERSN